MKNFHLLLAAATSHIPFAFASTPKWEVVGMYDFSSETNQYEPVPIDNVAFENGEISDELGLKEPNSHGASMPIHLKKRETEAPPVTAKDTGLFNPFNDNGCFPVFGPLRHQSRYGVVFETMPMKQATRFILGSTEIYKEVHCSQDSIDDYCMLTVADGEITRESHSLTDTNTTQHILTAGSNRIHSMHYSNTVGGMVQASTSSLIGMALGREAQMATNSLFGIAREALRQLSVSQDQSSGQSVADGRHETSSNGVSNTAGKESSVGKSDTESTGESASVGTSAGFNGMGVQANVNTQATANHGDASTKSQQESTSKSNTEHSENAQGTDHQVSNMHQGSNGVQETVAETSSTSAQHGISEAESQSESASHQDGLGNAYSGSYSGTVGYTDTTGSFKSQTDGFFKALGKTDMSEQSRSFSMTINDKVPRGEIRVAALAYRKLSVMVPVECKIGNEKEIYYNDVHIPITRRPTLIVLRKQNEEQTLKDHIEIDEIDVTSAVSVLSKGKFKNALVEGQVLDRTYSLQTSFNLHNSKTYKLSIKEDGNLVIENGFGIVWENGVHFLDKRHSFLCIHPKYGNLIQYTTSDIFGLFQPLYDNKFGQIASCRENMKGFVPIWSNVKPHQLFSPTGMSDRIRSYTFRLNNQGHLVLHDALGIRLWSTNPDECLSHKGYLFPMEYLFPITAIDTFVDPRTLPYSDPHLYLESNSVVLSRQLSESPIQCQFVPFRECSSSYNFFSETNRDKILGAKAASGIYAMLLESNGNLQVKLHVKRNGEDIFGRTQWNAHSGIDVEIAQGRKFGLRATENGCWYISTVEEVPIDIWKSHNCDNRKWNRVMMKLTAIGELEAVGIDGNGQSHLLWSSRANRGISLRDYFPAPVMKRNLQIRLTEDYKQLYYDADSRKNLAVLNSWHAYGTEGGDRVFSIEENGQVGSRVNAEIHRHVDVNNQSNITAEMKIIDLFNKTQEFTFKSTNNVNQYKIEYPQINCMLEIRNPASNCTSKVFEWTCNQRLVANATISPIRPKTLDLTVFGYGNYFSSNFFFTTASTLFAAHRDLDNCLTARSLIPEMPLAIDSQQWRCYKFQDEYMAVRTNEKNEVQCLGNDGNSCLRAPIAAYCNDHIDQSQDLKPFSCGAIHKNIYKFSGYDRQDHWCFEAERSIWSDEEPERAINQALVNMKNGGDMCLEIPNNSTNTTHTTLSKCNQTLEQQWTYRNGSIINSNGLCLDVLRGWTKLVGVVGAHECNGKENQKWEYNWRTKQFKSKVGNNKCLDLLIGATKEQFPAIIFYCNKQENQKWELQ